MNVQHSRTFYKRFLHIPLLILLTTEKYTFSIFFEFYFLFKYLNIFFVIFIFRCEQSKTKHIDRKNKT